MVGISQHSRSTSGGPRVLHRTPYHPSSPELCSLTLNCQSPSAFIASHLFFHITDAEDYESLFNVKKDDVKSTSCLRLVPSLLSQPVIRDTEEGLDLVYTVSFVSGDHSLHVGKVRKITMTQVFERLKSIKTTASAGKHQSKRENDYSFSFPRILK